MLLMRIIVPLLVVGLMSVSAGVAFGDSHGDGGNATSTDPGLDPNATSTVPSLPDEDGNGYKRKSFPGVVHYYGNDMVTVDKNGAGEYVDIAIVDDYSIIKNPGGPNNRGELGDGARVVVHAEWNGTEWVAIWVIVKPVKPTFTPIVGRQSAPKMASQPFFSPTARPRRSGSPKAQRIPRTERL